MDPDTARLQAEIEQLKRRVELLEQRAAPERPPERLHLVERQPVRPSLESRVGSQYLNRAGVVALLFGSAFFLSWAFSNNWIGPLAVVLLGALAGVGVIVLGEWFLNKGYSVFGLSLQGLGIAALYLTLWASAELYRLVPTFVAFAATVVLTFAVAFVAVSRSSEALAVFAAVGAFGTPLLLSVGRNLEFELFAYVLLLCMGVLSVLRYRAWLGLLIASFLGTAAVSIWWYIEFYRSTDEAAALIFFAALIACFLVAPVLIDHRADEAFRRDPLPLIPIAAAVLFWLALRAITGNTEFFWYSQLAAAALLVLAWRLRPGSLRACYKVLALAASVTSIPAVVNEHWETSAVWLGYGVALVVIGFSRRIAVLRWFALALLGVTIVKVFLLDLASLGQGYRILALSVLGVALLSLSFLYQRDFLGMRKP